MLGKPICMEPLEDDSYRGENDHSMHSATADRALRIDLHPNTCKNLPLRGWESIRWSEQNNRTRVLGRRVLRARLSTYNALEAVVSKSLIASA